MAFVAVLLECLLQDVFEVRWRVGDRRWIEMQNRRDDVARSVATKRRPAGGHLVEHDAEAEDVAARVDLQSPRLLRRHVLRRAHHEPGRRVRPDGRDSLGRLARGGPFLLNLREPEVHELRVAVLTHHDVFGFHIAMDDAGGVRGSERIGDLARDLE